MLARIFLFGLLLGPARGPGPGVRRGHRVHQVPQPQPTETDGKVEVLEFFWYGCPHCLHLEPLLKKWKATMPANAQFRRSPAILGRPGSPWPGPNLPPS